MLSGRQAAPLLVAIALVAAPLVGCGGEDEQGPAADERPRETVDPLPELPPGWREHVNGAAGFAIGVPPGWTASADGIRSVLRSPERLVAATVTADRTDEALAASLRQLASATISRLPGVEKLEPGQPRPYRAPYQAVAVRATGVARPDDVRERFLLVVMRRDRLANYSVLVARNAEERTGAYAGEIRRVVRSLRGRPIAPPSLTERAEGQ